MADFFFDFDGTLAPITARPEDASIPLPVRNGLARLAGLPGVSVSVVSGRALGDLRRRADLGATCLAGNHGLEILLGDREYVHPKAAALRPVLSRVARLLGERLGAVPGCRIEDKGLTVSVHYRQAPPASVADILRTVGDTLASPAFRNLFTLRPGKMVAEVRPLIQWDKGRAVLWTMERLRGSAWPERYLPVYVGDDETDEDAFRALAGKGLTVKVGAGPTAAAHAVPDTGVERLLGDLYRLAAVVTGRRGDGVGSTARD